MDDEAADLLAGEVEEAVHDGVGDDGAHGEQVEHGEQHQQPLVAVRAVLLQKHEMMCGYVLVTVTLTWTLKKLRLRLKRWSGSSEARNITDTATSILVVRCSRAIFLSRLMP